MKDTRRRGDNRDVHQEAKLKFTPAHDEPLRWLPKHGEPLCIAEWLSQQIVKALASLPVYTAIVVTVTLLLYVFGVPWVSGR